MWKEYIWMTKKLSHVFWLFSPDPLEYTAAVGIRPFPRTCHILGKKKKKNFQNSFLVFYLELKILISADVNFYQSSSPFMLLIWKSISWLPYLSRSLVHSTMWFAVKDTGMCRIMYISSLPAEGLLCARHGGLCGTRGCARLGSLCLWHRPQRGK